MAPSPRRTSTALTSQQDEVLYSVRPDPLDASARWLSDLSATWDRRLNALKQAAEAPNRVTTGSRSTEGADG